MNIYCSNEGVYCENTPREKASDATVLLGSLERFGVHRIDLILKWVGSLEIYLCKCMYVFYGL